MRYLLAVIFPPAAVFLCGKPMQAILSCFLCILFYFPAIVHALIVVANHKAEKRTNKIVKAIKSNS